MYGLSPVATSSKVLEYQEKLGFFQPSTDSSSYYFERSLHKSSNTYPNAKGKLWEVSIGDDSSSLKKGYLWVLWDSTAKETAKR